MTEQVLTISEIIEICGGVAAVAEATELSKDAVHQWRRIGIHQNNWQSLINSVSDERITAASLLAANEALRTKTQQGD